MDPSLDYKYWAFISYSHKDEKWAAWLQRSLERYRVPRSFVGRSTSGGIVPKRLYPLFRDREELPSSSSLSHEIQESLRLSRNLLIVCSPHAVASNWVNEEIQSFKHLGRASRIFCLIVDGEPYASDNPGEGLPEAFPQALRLNPGSDGDLVQQRIEPIAADARKGKDGKRRGKLKLVAGILDIRLSELIKRDQRRRLWQGTLQAAAAVLVLTVILGIWWRGKQSTLAETQRADEQTRVASTQKQVASMRALVSRAQAIFDQEPAHLHAGILLAIEAMHRGIGLRQPADEAINVLRSGLALLPGSLRHRVEHQERLTKGAYSHDGRWLATIEGKKLRLWDAVTETDELLSLPGDGVSLAFSPDNSRLLTLSNNAVQTWDPTTRTRVNEQSFQKELSYQAILSPDSMWLASTGESPSDLLILEAATGKLLRSMATRQPVTSMEFSPNGRLLATGVAGQGMTGAIDPAVQLWDIKTGKELISQPHETFVDAIAFSSDSHLIATGSGATIRVWNTATGQQVSTLTNPSSSEIDKNTASVTFGKDGRWLASAAGTCVQVWEIATRHVVARMPDSEGVFTFSPDGSTLLTADGRLWRMNSEEQLSRLTPGKEDLVGISLGAHGTMLATGLRKGGANIWDEASAQLIAHLPEDSWTSIRAFASDGRFVATMSGTSIGSACCMRVWEVKTGRKVADISSDSTFNAVTFSPDGTYIATGAEDGKTVIYITATGEVAHILQLKGAINSVDFSPDGGTLAVAGENGEVWLWNPASDNKRRFEGAEKDWPVIAFSPDGKQLAVGGGGNSVVVWDVFSGKELLKKSFKDRVTGFAFSGDGRTAVAVANRAVYVLETATGKNLAEIQPEIPKVKPRAGNVDDAGVTGFAFSTDGEWLAIAWQEQSQGGYTVELWHAPTGRKLATLAKDVEQVEFSPDAPRMATLTKDGVRVEFWHPARLMEEACARVARDFTDQERQMYLPGETSQPTCRALAVPVD